MVTKQWFTKFSNGYKTMVHKIFQEAQ